MVSRCQLSYSDSMFWLQQRALPLQVMMAERMKRGIKAEMEEAREILVRRQPCTRCFTVGLHLHDAPVVISLQAVAIAGLIISMALWALVAVATPLPVLVKSIPSNVRQRLARRHA